MLDESDFIPLNRFESSSSRDRLPNLKISRTRNLARGHRKVGSALIVVDYSFNRPSLRSLLVEAQSGARAHHP
jgi:hypothetical protein